MGESSAMQAKIRSEPRRHVAEVFQFLAAQRAPPVLPLDVLRLNLVTLVTVRRTGTSEGEILATVGAFRPPVRCLPQGVAGAKFDVFVLDATAVARELAPFRTSLIGTLTNTAIMELAWVHASDDERRACVLVLASVDDQDLQGEMLRVGAQRISPLPQWLERLIEPNLDESGILPNVWCIDAACAARIARQTVDRPSFYLVTRNSLGPGPAKLSLAVDIGWRTLGREYLRQLANGSCAVPWVQPPENGLVSIAGGLSRRSANGF
ncbi:MAG: hypothetical protein JWO81_721 [Alphaproteobacteria bacterium]|nr:hypothetical protein [Alphaproteobacteria bacterium]